MEQIDNTEVEAPGTKYGALRLPKDVLDDLAVWKIAYALEMKPSELMAEIENELEAE